MRIEVIVLAMLALGPASATATEIYRCTGASGEPEYRQRPCADASTRLSVPVAPAGSVQRGLRASERAWLAGRRATRSTPRRAAADASVEDAGKQRRVYQCRKKRHALDGVRAELRRGYKPARGERLRRRRRAYEDYLAAFCS